VLALGDLGALRPTAAALEIAEQTAARRAGRAPSRSARSRLSAAVAHSPQTRKPRRAAACSRIAEAPEAPRRVDTERPRSPSWSAWSCRGPPLLLFARRGKSSRCASCASARLIDAALVHSRDRRSVIASCACPVQRLRRTATPHAPADPQTGARCSPISSPTRSTALEERAGRRAAPRNVAAGTNLPAPELGVRVSRLPTFIARTSRPRVHAVPHVERERYRPRLRQSRRTVIAHGGTIEVRSAAGARLGGRGDAPSRSAGRPRRDETRVLSSRTKRRFRARCPGCSRVTGAE